MDARSGKLRHLFGVSESEPYARGTNFSADGKRLAIVRGVDEESASQATVFDVATGRRLASLAAAQPGTIV